MTGSTRGSSTLCLNSRLLCPRFADHAGDSVKAIHPPDTKALSYSSGRRPTVPERAPSAPGSNSTLLPHRPPLRSKTNRSNWWRFVALSSATSVRHLNSKLPAFYIVTLMFRPVKKLLQELGYFLLSFLPNSRSINTAEVDENNNSL